MAPPDKPNKRPNAGVDQTSDRGVDAPTPQGTEVDKPQSAKNVTNAAVEARKTVNVGLEKEKLPKAIANAPDSMMKTAYIAAKNLVDENPKLKGPLATAILGALAWAAKNMDFFPGKYVERIMTQVPGEFSKEEAGAVLGKAMAGQGKMPVNLAAVSGKDAFSQIDNDEHVSVLGASYAVFGQRFDGVKNTDDLFARLAKLRKPGAEPDKDGNIPKAFEMDTAVGMMMGGKLPEGSLACLALNPLAGKVELAKMDGVQGKVTAIADGKGNFKYLDKTEGWVYIPGKDVGFTAKYSLLAAVKPNVAKVNEKKKEQQDAPSKAGAAGKGNTNKAENNTK